MAGKISRLSFYDEISKNKRNSYLLISVVFFVLIALSYVIALAIGGEYFWIILIFGMTISIVYVFVGYYKSAEIAVASVGAKLAKRDSLELRRYHHLVEGICLASGMPKPKLYVMNSAQINAFASGRDPKNSVLCVTSGALEKLDKRELEGVLAHEMSHVANYDIRFMTLTAVLVGMIAIISQIFLRSLFFRSFSGDRNEQGNAIFIIVGIALAILAPIIVALVQLAISRKREYNADATAVKFMRTPTPLISALTKIKNEGRTERNEIKSSGAVSPLFFEKPDRKKEIFMTHPLIEKRIEKLKRM